MHPGQEKARCPGPLQLGWSDAVPMLLVLAANVQVDVQDLRKSQQGMWQGDIISYKYH